MCVGLSGISWAGILEDRTGKYFPMNVYIIITRVCLLRSLQHTVCTREFTARGAQKQLIVVFFAEVVSYSAITI